MNTLMNVIGNIPEEVFVPQERFINISFSKKYFNPALNCYIFTYLYIGIFQILNTKLKYTVLIINL